MRRLRRSLVRGWLLAGKVRARLFPPRPTRRAAGGAALTPPAASLAGAVVLIAGASRGIGAALAQAFADAGATVLLAARSAAPLEALAARLRSQGHQAHALVADLTRAADVQAMCAAAEHLCGGLDVLVLNAGIGGPSQLDAYAVPAESWAEVWRSNVQAPVRCIQLAAAMARRQQRPLRVIATSSGIVGHAAPRLGPYAASKDALEAALRAFALDRSPDDPVSLCAIQPRSVQSALTRDYYGAASHALLDDPAVVAPAFLWAATAPAAAVNGRCLVEAAFAADPDAATRLRPPFHASAALAIHPATFREPGAATLPGAYLHLLENAEGFSPQAAAALRSAAESRVLFAYPDPQYPGLVQAIAEDTGARPEQVLVAPGSSDLIDRVLRLFTGPGDEVVMTRPSWSFFHAFVQRWQVAPVQVPMHGSLSSASLQHDLDALAAAVTPRTRVLYLVNPCNPTGTVVDAQALQDFLLRLPGHVLAVVDEAYVQYAEPGRVPALASLLEQCAAPVLVLRTFSKFFGLAGMRLGYALGRAATLRLLARAELPFAITAPTVIAAVAALQDQDFRQRVHARNAAGRRQLLDGLAALGLAAQPSQTNFILFDSPVAPPTLHAALRRQGLVLPQVDQFLRNHMLLAVGRAEHNALVLDCLSKY